MTAPTGKAAGFLANIFVTNSTDGITQAQQNALRRKTLDKLNKLSPEQTENILSLLREQKNQQKG